MRLPVKNRHDIASMSRDKVARKFWIIIGTVAMNFVPVAAANEVILKLKPSQCIAIHQGKTCYVDVKLRWHYFNPNSGDWDWYAQIDNVSLSCDNEPQDLRCDVNLDGFVDRSDIRLISIARNQPAVPGDPRDTDGDGTITISDARQCVQVCTLPRCAPQP